MGRFSFWVGLICVVSFGQRLIAGNDRQSGTFVLSIMVLVPLLTVLLFRYATRRLLWSVRNRLILTYVLMGLAPVILFGTLTAVAAYIFSGQYAINTALSSEDRLLSEIRTEAVGAADMLVSPLTYASQRKKGPIAMEEVNNTHEAQMAVAEMSNGVWRAVPIVSTRGVLRVTPFAGQPQPAWMHRGFQGVVEYGGALYLCRETETQTDSRSSVVLASMPLDAATLGAMADRLGLIQVFPGFTLASDEGSNEDAAVDKAADKAARMASQPETIDSMRGGALPETTHLIDPRVYFTAPLQVTSWATGKPASVMMLVASRPSVLYSRLFETSAGVGNVLRRILIAIALSFSLIELIALWLAIRLSRTITRSVAGLYRGTTEIDGGNLNYRVKVERRDQFGALATSFNRMAGSIQDLLLQQREKDRLLSELAIAQEVQRNLFPHSPVSLPGLDLHAVCLPARSVSGDYFDFIFAETAEKGGQTPERGGHENGAGGLLCLALGDISGKGISAALLMASLHSAVRAFSVDDKSSGTVPSPAMLLEKLNRHLYRSTESNKYATLFVAFYDRASRQLTYSNGGHLPPMLLSSDGSLRKLECGGSVVGLLDGLQYEQETIPLHAGDLLIAYSDGMTEPENESGEFGEDRLLALLRQNRDQALPVLATDTFQTVKAWIGDKEQPDDMTLLFARAL